MFHIATRMFTSVCVMLFSPSRTGIQSAFVRLDCTGLQSSLQVIDSGDTFRLILSTMHQSSWDDVLIVPEKLYPLWYSPETPIFYFISAVAVGLAMVIFESALTSRAFGRAFDMDVLNGVARALVVVLAVFAVMRINFLYVEGSLSYVFMWRFETFMFALEFVLGAIVPIVILSLRRFRHNANWLFTGSVLAILGFVLHRGNVVMTGMQRYLVELLPELGRDPR